MLVNSIPLHKTVVAIDPKTPVKTSCLADLYKAQSKYKIASIDIGEMQKGKENVIDLIKKNVSDGIRNICFDAVTDDDLDFIAECGIEAGFSFINVSPGPIGADSVFYLTLKGKFNSVLSLYHDQGHIATKTLDFERTISVTGGMPVLRTSVDHGTAMDIAGKNIASEVSMVEAIRLAAKYSPNFR